jgi:hypothetical protein
VDFNKENPDVPGVRYFSYCGAGPTSLLLEPTYAFIASKGQTNAERTNDGMVSMASAQWPAELAEPPWAADHIGEVGHNLDTFDLRTTFDHNAAFDRVIKRATGEAGEVPNAVAKGVG